MSLNQRRATGHGNNPFIRIDKSDLVSILAQHGAKLTEKTIHKGAWNQGRRFFINGEFVEFTFKGDTPDWQAMLDEFLKNQG